MVHCYYGPLRFGMRAAFRMPWRVSGFDPARVVRRTTKSARGPLNRFYTTSANTSISLPSSKSFINQRNNASRGPCRPCCTRGQPSPKRHYSSETPAQETASNNGKRQSGQDRSRNKTKYIIVGGALGVAAVAYSDEVQHLYRAAARTGRVVSALAVCINE